MTDVKTLLPPINAGFTKSTSEFKIYKKRWLVLFIFSINSLANASLFSGISAINNIASKYWDVNPNVIDWLPNSFVIIYIFIALPSAYMMTSVGLRVSMLISSSLNAIAAALHFAGYKQEGFPFIMSGQIVAALSVGGILQIPPRLSTVWFPEKEHALATSIATFMNIFGVSIGFLQPTQMVPDTDNISKTENGMYGMFLSQLIFLGVCLVLVYGFFDESPPTPPSFAAAVTEKDGHVVSFMDSLKLLARNKHYNLLVHSYGIYFGMYVFFSVVLNEMVHTKVSVPNIGWMGFMCELFGAGSILICGVFIDKFQCYQVLSMVVFFGVTVGWTAFSLVLLHTNSTIAIFGTYALVGVFGIPYFAVGIERAAEMTYPIPEGTSSAIILMAGNLYGFIFVIFFGAWVDKGRTALVCYITIGLYAFAFILTCLTKTELKRQSAEKVHQLRPDDTIDDVSDEHLSGLA